MRKFIAGALIAGTTLPLLAGVATAAPDRARDVDSVKAKCTAAVDARLTELTKLDGAVTAAKNVTDGHRSTMTSNNAAARAGLTDLKTKIAGDAVELVVGAEEDLAAVVIGTGIGRQFFDMPIECEL